MLRTGLAGAVAAVGLAVLAAALAPPAARAQAGPARALIAFLPTPPIGSGTSPLAELDARPVLSLGFLNASQGPYAQEQALLDLSQGARVSRNGYGGTELEDLGFVALPGGRGRLEGWGSVVARARDAPADVVPGLLAGAVSAGGAYAGAVGGAQTEAIVVADRGGSVAGASLGQARSLAERARALLARHRLVAVGLPPRAVGLRELDELLAARRPSELVLVVQTPPDRRATQLLAVGAVGLGGGPPGAISSPTTRRDGLVAGIDVAPTVLEHLGLDVPAAVSGRSMAVTGERDAGALRRLSRRLRVVYPRRIPALRAVAISWVVLFGVLWITGGGAGRRRALRVGGLAVLWIPSVVLVTAALAPSRSMEVALVAGGALGLAALSDWVLPWPRGPALPALVGVAAYGVDLARGSDLIVRSLLGPNPRFGSRFYGIGNELEATLPLLALFGLAGALVAWPRSPRLAWAFGGAMLFLGAVIGSGRLGADVGGVISVAAGGAAAVLLALPGRPSRRGLLLAAAMPAVALAALAVLDLTTGGDSHFSGVLGGDSGDFADTVARRYELAWAALNRGLTPVLTVAAIALAVFGYRRRAALYAPLGGAPAWRAGLGGALSASVAGALFNDSGPLLLLFGVFILAWITAYVRGDPALGGAEAVSGKAG